MVEISDERFDRLMDRFDAFMDRFDRREERMDETMRQIKQEFELNREIQNHLLQQSRESHREVMERLEDLGVHMREQTQALIDIRGRIGPSEA